MGEQVVGRGGEHVVGRGVEQMVGIWGLNMRWE